jgi:thiosulfate dehydrogenase
MQLQFSKSAGFRLLSIMIVTIIVVISILTRFVPKKEHSPVNNITALTTGERFLWHPPDTTKIPFTVEGMLIRYGRDLIANTSFYLGPKGKVAAITNGMNCQNCHLDAGTRLWGNNYSGVFATYPRFRERSGTIENIYKRVNDCIERSLNGNKLDTTSHEMLAIAAYIKWLGQNVPRNIRPEGVGISDLPFLSRAADPALGKLVYEEKCQRCHGADGSGLLHTDNSRYVYPPLWGKNSYNTGAGLYRLSRFAGYVKDNMPFGVSHNATQLTDEAAWDVAAFVNSQPRPAKHFSKDWPAISGKPVDHPFGPYIDSFSEKQHKYGPFVPIIEAHKKPGNKNTKPS